MNDYLSHEPTSVVAATDKVTLAIEGGGNRRIGFTDLITAVTAAQQAVSATLPGFSIGCDILAKVSASVTVGQVVAATLPGGSLNITPQCVTNSVFSASGDIISNVCSTSNTTWMSQQSLVSNQIGIFSRVS